MKANSKVANKSSEIDKSKDLLKLISEISDSTVNMRPINKKEREFLKSQGEPVDEGIIYVIEKKKMIDHDC